MEGARDARRQIGDGAAARHDPVGRRRGEVREQVDEAAATSGDGKASEAIGEIVSSGDEVDAPRGEAAVGSAANEGSSAMAAASSGGEANELIDEVAGEHDEPKKKVRRRAKGSKSHDKRKRQQRRTAAEAAGDT